jgi:hypothetical protein
MMASGLQVPMVGEGSSGRNKLAARRVAPLCKRSSTTGIETGSSAKLSRYPPPETSGICAKL